MLLQKLLQSTHKNSSSGKVNCSIRITGETLIELSKKYVNKPGNMCCRLSQGFSTFWFAGPVDKFFKIFRPADIFYRQEQICQKKVLLCISTSFWCLQPLKLVKRSIFIDLCNESYRKTVRYIEFTELFLPSLGNFFFDFPFKTIQFIYRYPQEFAHNTIHPTKTGLYQWCQTFLVPLLTLLVPLTGLVPVVEKCCSRLLCSSNILTDPFCPVI